MMEFKPNRQAIEEIQLKANAHIQGIVRQTNKDMAGKPAATVEAELTKRLKAGGVKPNAANVRELARAISRGEVTG